MQQVGAVQQIALALLAPVFFPCALDLDPELSDLRQADDDIAAVARPAVVAAFAFRVEAVGFEQFDEAFAPVGF